MVEQKIDLSQIAEVIARAKCFSEEEQTTLADLLKRNGPSDTFFHEATKFFEKYIEKGAQKYEAVYGVHRERIAAAEDEMDNKRAVIAKDLKDKLAVLSDTDFVEKSKLFDEYNKAVAVLNNELERKIKELGVKAMIAAL